MTATVGYGQRFQHYLHHRSVYFGYNDCITVSMCKGAFLAFVVFVRKGGLVFRYVFTNTLLGVNGM